MNVTIKDVAKLAQVSISTVSRVINGAPNITPEIRQKVEKAIAQLRYKPNIIAQSLGSGRLKNIAVVLARSSQLAFVNPYFTIMFQGLGSVIENSDYEVLLTLAEDEKTEVDKCMSLIDAGSIQGVILLGSRVYDKLINKLIEIKFPFVLIGRVLKDAIPEGAQINHVDTDSINDSMAAVSYLISQGHRRIGCVHAPLKYVVSQDRYSGYCIALRHAEIPVDDSIIVDGGYSWQDAEKAARIILQQKNPPTAIFATDDLKAIGVMKAAYSLGLKVPEDLSIMGHNDYDFAQMVEPPLSTVRVPIYELGKVAAEIMLEQIKNPGHPPKQVILPTQLVIRNSIIKKDNSCTMKKL
ncbi:LacI family DNA-binding transcriptional regulator [Petroclostridium xylanilyticum]|uniref:LacI family DNA-binding transcriptional regulator n=1 Tax=Petroclostridium xylanilyticum TaxID=1792311 RepID=UPI000B992D34|nr:LacI family DNA-binding transcriptional regulator [Petroclostridium xylanilyticum]